MNHSRLAGVMSACFGLFSLLSGGLVQAQFNSPPTANAGPDIFANEGDFVMLDGTGSTDPDGDYSIASYAWSQTAGPAALNFTGNATPTPNFQVPVIGGTGATMTFQLKVGDDFGDTDTDFMNVFIQATAVPVPAALWLFGSGLLGLVGMARRRTVA